MSPNTKEVPMSVVNKDGESERSFSRQGFEQVADKKGVREAHRREGKRTRNICAL